MIIAIDYDNTYTAAPEIWDQVIKLFQDAGHTVVCVTGRSDNSSMAPAVLDSIGKLVPVVFAGEQWKQDAAKKRGYKIDIWIDDMPVTIGPQILIGRA